MISSYLKEKGHQTQIVFLPINDLPDEKFSSSQFQYPAAIMDGLAELCAGSGLIGITLYTNYFFQAAQVTKFLKEKLDVPIIWGGIHPTCHPDACLDYVDMVCIGEGEEVMSDLVDRISEGKDFYDIPNIWFKKDGGIIKNPIRPLQQNLDTMPFQDIEMESHFMIHENRLAPISDITMEVWPTWMRYAEDQERVPTYLLMTSLGCAYNCNFCCNSRFIELYKGKGRRLRFRSVSNVIAELEHVKKKLGFVQMIAFMDDVFFSRKLEELQEFSKIYKDKIGLPFLCNVAPSTVSAEKLNCMIDAGMTQITMGIQSGSERVNREVYNRPIKNNAIINASRIISDITRLRDPRIIPQMDIISDNPYETEDDLLDTINLISKLKKPFYFAEYSLVFYPGTSLYHKAKEDGFIKDEIADVIDKRYFHHTDSLDYLQFLVTASPPIPGFVLKILSNKTLLPVFKKLFGPKFFTLLLATHPLRKIRMVKALFRRIKGLFKYPAPVSHTYGLE